MGRPIKKKFFANLNSPYQNQATGGPTGEGGESIASVTIDTVGSYTSALPTISFGTPDLYSGVQATGVVHGKALSAAIGARGTGYNVGDLVVQHNGATGTYATWRVRSVRVISYTIDTTGQSQFDGDERLALDSTVDPKWTTAFVIDVNGGGLPNYVITGSALQQAGIWNGGTGYTPAPTHIAITGGGAGHVTRGSGDTPNYGATSDNNGAGGYIDVVYGIETLDLVSEGDYTAITSGAKTLDYVTGSGGTGATATITYGVKNVVLTNPGSHYISSADAAATFSTGAAAGTAVLANSADNGLAAYAHIHDGVEGSIVDIMKQESSRRYLVKERDGKQGQCRLVAKNSGDLLVGEMCLIATDTQGCTYWITKLTARRAYLKRRSSAGTGYQFADGSSAGWKITSATTGYVSVATV